MEENAKRKDLDFETISPRCRAVVVDGKTLLVGPVVLRVWKEVAALGQQIAQGLAEKFPAMETSQVTPALIVGEAMEELPRLFALVVKEKRGDGTAGPVEPEWFLDHVDCAAALSIVEALMEANQWEQLLGKYQALAARVQEARAGARSSTSSRPSTDGPADTSSIT